MVREILVRVVVLGVLAAVAEARVSGTSYSSGKRNETNEIPQLCVESSVTAVWCAGAVPRDALLPHPDDCRLFYYCVSPDAAPLCRQCPAGLHFNPDKYVCDRVADAGCQANNKPNKHDQIATFPSKLPQPEDDIPASCIEHSVSEVSCAAWGGVEGDGLLPHPDDCELFYACAGADATPVCRQCPASLHFNPILHVCDNPQDAGCVIDTKNN